MIVAETGGDMSVFPSAAHLLASWAGVAPGSNESAGKVKSAKVRPGDKHLKGALGIAAKSVTRSKGTYLCAKYRRISARRGHARALVALERTMLASIWHMGTTGEVYTDLGGDYHHRIQPGRTKRRALEQLRALGYEVTLTEAC